MARSKGKGAMDWSASVDGYCERLGPGYWAEPVNALTNLAFIVAAILMWRRCAGLPEGRVLAGILFAIGVGSWLFHTHATPWAGLLDVVPILVFGLAYLWRANRDFLGLGKGYAALGAAAFLPLAAAIAPVFRSVPVYGPSAGYMAFPVVFAAYAFGLRRRLPDVSRGLWIAFGILMVSLTFRGLDDPLCAAFPLGTHFLWHLLNALLLGWVIEVWRRWRLAKG